eukprot:1157482-Pelagomonas_calceolata.AAC.3
MLSHGQPPDTHELERQSDLENRGAKCEGTLKCASVLLHISLLQKTRLSTAADLLPFCFS